MSKTKQQAVPELSRQEKLKRYAVNKLKALALEIEKHDPSPVDPNETASWVVRKEIFTELLHESSR